MNEREYHEAVNRVFGHKDAPAKSRRRIVYNTMIREALCIGLIAGGRYPDACRALTLNRTELNDLLVLCDPVRFSNALGELRAITYHRWDIQIRCGDNSARADALPRRGAP